MPCARSSARVPGWLPASLPPVEEEDAGEGLHFCSKVRSVRAPVTREPGPSCVVCLAEAFQPKEEYAQDAGIDASLIMEGHQRSLMFWDGIAWLIFNPACSRCIGFASQGAFCLLRALLLA